MKYIKNLKIILSVMFICSALFSESYATENLNDINDPVKEKRTNKRLKNQAILFSKETGER